MSYENSSTSVSGSNASIDMRNDRDAPSGIVGENARVMTDAEGLAYENPDYLENIERWTKYSDCYEANDIYKYIRKHTRESEDMFSARVRRGYYYNYCASVVDLFVAYLFHAPIVREAGSLTEEFDEIYENSDLAGTKYVYQMQIAATYAQIFGHCGALIDAPRVPEGGFQNEAQRKQAKFRPYISLVRAPQILDWELDDQGNFVWVKIQICRPEPERAWNVKVDSDRKNYVIWTRHDWTEYSVSGDDVQMVGTSEHPLGVVPLVIIKNEKMPSHEWLGSSALRDIADINLAILNWSSLGDEEIAERCLNILTMERDNSDAPAVLSHSNVLEYAPGAKAPEYLTPGETPLKLIGEWIDRAKGEIYRLAKLGGSTGLLGVREATSGIAYAYEFNETNQSLARKAESMEQAEIEIHRLLARWLQKDFDGKVEYPKEFGVDDFLTEFAVLTEARANLTSETAIKQIEKNLAHKIFARENTDFRVKIDKEIDEAGPTLLGLAENFQSVPGAITKGPIAQSKPGSAGPQPASAG